MLSKKKNIYILNSVLIKLALPQVHLSASCDDRDSVPSISCGLRGGKANNIP